MRVAGGSLPRGQVGVLGRSHQRRPTASLVHRLRATAFRPHRESATSRTAWHQRQCARRDAQVTRRSDVTRACRHAAFALAAAAARPSSSRSLPVQPPWCPQVELWRPRWRRRTPKHTRATPRGVIPERQAVDRVQAQRGSMPVWRGSLPLRRRRSPRAHRPRGGPVTRHQ